MPINAFTMLFSNEAVGIVLSKLVLIGTVLMFKRSDCLNGCNTRSLGVVGAGVSRVGASVAAVGAVGARVSRVGAGAGGADGIGSG